MASGLGALMLSALMVHLTQAAANVRELSATANDLPGLPAYLYRLDPESGFFVTIPLPAGSRPGDVSVISDAGHTEVWFTEPGRQLIGRVIYTSPLDYALREYYVGAGPVDLDASETAVWFTVPDQDQVGRVEVATGIVGLLDLPSVQSDPADVAIDPSGQVWVTERAANHLTRITVSPTVTIAEYTVAGGSLPEGVAAQDGSVWFAAGATDAVWRFTPATSAYLSVPLPSPGSQPYRLAFDGADGVWVTLRGTGQLARLTLAPLTSTTVYTLPGLASQPGAINLDALDRVYFVEEALDRIGQLVVTPTTAFAEFSPPDPDLELTSLDVAGDGAVWVVAYHDVYQTRLPLVVHDYDSVRPPFGIQMYGNLNASNGFTYVVEARGSWVRLAILWSTIEPVNTTPDNYFWANLDASIQTAVVSDVMLIATLEGNPAWAAEHPGGPVNNLADLQEFVGAIVARYPQVRYWELYNEPDREDRFGANGAGYANMLKAIYPVIKAANSNAQVLMGGLALDWFTEEGGPFDSHFLTDTLSACTGSLCFDIANFHYYPAFRHKWEAYGRDIWGKTNYLRQVFANYGYNVPLVNTEMGWPAGTIWGSPALSARYVPKVYVRTFAARLPLANWFALLDADASNPGLLGPGLTPRPAYAAYRTMTSVLRNARFVRSIPATETGSARLEGYQFSVTGVSGRKRLDVYWYDCPSMYTPALYTNGAPADCSSRAPLQVSAAQVARIDHLGNRIVLADGADGQLDGRVTVPNGVDTNPIYIDYTP